MKNILAFGVAFVCATSVSFAATLKVTNETPKEISLTVTPDGGTESATLEGHVPANGEKEYEVSSHEIHGKNYFNLEVAAPHTLLDAACKDASGNVVKFHHEEKYEVTLQEPSNPLKPGGVHCLVKEIK